MKIQELNRIVDVVEKAEHDADLIGLSELLYEPHENPSHRVPGYQTIGIELESKRKNKKYKNTENLLTLNALEICNFDDEYSWEYGYENSPNSLWDATFDCTVDVEYVSNPLMVQDAERALRAIYAFGGIRGDEETGNHYHVNLDWVDNTDVFSLLGIYLAPELKDASRRSFAAWNKWSACRYETLSDVEDMIHFYNEEFLTWDYPMIRLSNHVDTIEYRGFTTPRYIDTALMQLEAVVKMVEISNDISYKLMDYDIWNINSIHNSEKEYDIITDTIEDCIDETNIYNILKDISRGK